MKNKRGQLSLADAPTVVLLVGLIFLIMATIAFIGSQYGNAIKTAETGPGCNSTDNSNCGAAFNVTQSLGAQINSNTSIAGIVLTIALVGIVLTVLIGIFMVTRRSGRA